MSEYLSKLVLPPNFILARVVPTVRELVYGYHHGLVDDDGAVRLGEAQYALGMPQTPSVEEVALLLRDEYYNVERLMLAAVEELGTNRAGPEGEHPSKVWLYLALSWAYAHRSEYEEPLLIVEILWADFDYPWELKSLIWWQPKEKGELPGDEGILQRWHDYLVGMDKKYAERTACFAGGEWTPTNSG